MGEKCELFISHFSCDDEQACRLITGGLLALWASNTALDVAFLLLNRLPSARSGAPAEAKTPMIKWLRRFHLVMMCVWVVLAIPGIIWWKESILFVIILSLYANFAGEFAAYQGARAEEKQDE